MARQYQKMIKDRDILFIPLENNSQVEHAKPFKLLPLASRLVLQKMFSEKDPKQSFFVLIGKDGKEKARSPFPRLPHFFHLIDQMPMRQHEMKRKN